jgi:hypothetical protein
VFAVGIRTRGLDIKAGAKRNAADKAARGEAKAIVDRWNEQLATGRDMLWSPTIRAALLADMPWLDVFLPGLRNEPRSGSARGRSPPARVGRHTGAGLAVLVVP